MINSIRKENDMQKEDVLVSVIVPVYNTDKYLEMCLDSIINQTYKNIEIVLMDDGSTDNSGIICDEYAGKDSRIKVHHHKNVGPAWERKFGVEVCNGAYVVFIDSDDWINAEFVEKLLNYRNQQDVDMVTSGLIYEEEKSNTNAEKRTLIDAIPEGVYDRNEIRDYMMPSMMYEPEKKRQGITASLCNKLLKTSTLRSVLQKSDTSLRLGEDGAIVYPFIAMAEKIVVTHYCGYHYIQRSDSKIHTYSLSSFEEVYHLHNYLKSFFEKANERMKVNVSYEEYTVPFLRVIIEDVYGVKVKQNCYVPPYEIMPQGSRIVLYGAGAVGKWYERALKHGEYVTLVGWVDKAYGTYPKQYNIKSPARLTELEYDYILIAVSQEAAVEEIMHGLLEMNIPKDKILWKKPVIIN